MKVIPAAFIIKEGIDAVKRTYEENIKNRTGRSALKGMFGRCEIDKETYLALYDTGKFYSTDPGYRDSLSGLTAGLIDSSETMRERLLKASEGNKEQDDLRRAALSQMAKNPEFNFNPFAKLTSTEGRQVFQELIKKQDGLGASGRSLQRIGHLSTQSRHEMEG